MIDGEKPLKVLTHLFLVKLFLRFFDTKILCNLLKKYFQKHSASSCCCFRLQNNDLKDSPIYGEPEKKMPKEFGQVSDFIDLKLEDCVIMIDKGLDKEFLIQVINETESFRQ